MFRIIEWIERLCERIYYGPEDNDPVVSHSHDLANALVRHTDTMLQAVLEKKDTYWRDRNKQDRLERELDNAEWILDYEKRLINLQKKTAAQRSDTEQAGINTERLRKLEHHLTGLRRNLSLD
jgi:hypothetical protein